MVALRIVSFKGGGVRITKVLTTTQIELSDLAVMKHIDKRHSKPSGP